MASRLHLETIARVGRASLTLLFFAAGVNLYAFLVSYVDNRGTLWSEFALTLTLGALMYPAFQRLEPVRVTLEGYFAFVAAIAAIHAAVTAAGVSEPWQIGVFMGGVLLFAVGLFRERRQRRTSSS